MRPHAEVLEEQEARVANINNHRKKYDRVESLDCEEGRVAELEAAHNRRRNVAHDDEGDQTVDGLL